LTLPVEESEELRMMFQRRLQDDLQTFGSLASRFVSADVAPAPVLEEVRDFAHRLRGAAAIFQAHELSRSAQVLEAAATLAVSGCARNTPPSLSSLLQTLLGQISLRIDAHSGAPDEARQIAKETLRTS
jgi:HPt (histidine-containing phosphotransfer) domain-containing protein